MPTSLKILCFGASLVRGHTANGTKATPFAIWTKGSLATKWPEKEISFKVDGMSGGLVTRDFEGRMERAFEDDEQTSTRRPLYDWVILLGGTNDLGWGKPPLAIHDALTRVSDIALENGAKVLLCTVPECGVKSENLDRKRDGLNTFIRGDVRDDVYIFDLNAKIPYHSMPEQEREEIWDDGLHFTAKGYERMGEMIAERLIEIIEKETEEDGKKEATTTAT